MCTTYSCLLEKSIARFAQGNLAESDTLSRADFERMVSRRQRPKIATTTHIAAAIFKHFRLNERLEKMECDASNTPILICNRYANWDYVANFMCSEIEPTLERVNNYVATAWFPTTIQGFLTIEYGNIGEAITLATTDTEFLVASIQSLFARDSTGSYTGAVILGTFECLPENIGNQQVTGKRHGAFGAVSLISSNDSDNTIRAAVLEQQEIYKHVFS